MVNIMYKVKSATLNSKPVMYLESTFSEKYYLLSDILAAYNKPNSILPSISYFTVPASIFDEGNNDSVIFVDSENYQIILDWLQGTVTYEVQTTTVNGKPVRHTQSLYFLTDLLWAIGEPDVDYWLSRVDYYELPASMLEGYNHNYNVVLIDESTYNNILNKQYA